MREWNSTLPLVRMISAAILAGFLQSAAFGQSPEISPQLKNIVTKWDKCFLASTQHQFLKDLEAEPNLVAELAFQACSTEEQTLKTYLLLGQISQEQALAIILRHRNHLKQKITGY